MISVEYENPITKLSILLDVPEAALRLLISILIGFPLAYIHRSILYGKNPTCQHLFFTISGFALGYWNFEYNVFHSVAALCITYLTLKVLGNSGLSVIATFVFNMVYLLWGYYTTSTRDYDITWTMPQCVLTLRLIGLSFNLWDGKKAEGTLSASQKEVALKTHPSLLETAAFVYFPASFLIGPQFSMKRYLDFTNGLLAQRDSPDRIKLPDSVTAGLLRAALGFFYIALFQLGSRYVPNHYFFSDEYLKESFIKRCFLLGLWGRVNLYKYISCWLIAEGACITFGLTYNGQDLEGRSKWDGCANVDLITFENATQFNHYIQSFNINTNQWSAEYIYKRLKFLGSKLYSQLFTLIFLALWHGFHSGYYMCFLMEFIVMYFEKDIGPVLAKNVTLQVALKSRLEIRILVWIILKIYTFIFMGYSVIPFFHLSYTRYVQVYASVYYCGHVFFLSYPFLKPFIKRFLNGQNSRREHEE